MGTNVIEMIAITMPGFLFAIVCHEFAHAYVALRFGDTTAKDMGRLSLNPLVHIDIWGTVIFPLVLIAMNGTPFGWAKPVPVNPLNLRNPRRDNLWISAAGPASNLTVATICLIGIVFLKVLKVSPPQNLHKRYSHHKSL